MEKHASTEKSNTEKKKCFEKYPRHVMTDFTHPTCKGIGKITSCYRNDYTK
jgi:hypothetical protein